MLFCCTLTLFFPCRKVELSDKRCSLCGTIFCLLLVASKWLMHVSITLKHLIKYPAHHAEIDRHMEQRLVKFEFVDFNVIDWNDDHKTGTNADQHKHGSTYYMYLNQKLAFGVNCIAIFAVGLVLESARKELAQTKFPYFVDFGVVPFSFGSFLLKQEFWMLLFILLLHYWLWCIWNTVQSVQHTLL